MNSIDRDYVRKLLSDIEEAISVILEDCSKPFEALSRTEKSEARYYIVVLVEAVIALAYHIARNLYGIEPRTPVQTLRLLADRGLISYDELEDMVKLVRLRNLIVHRYWVVDDRIIYENVKKDFKHIRSFVERVRNALGL